MFYSDQQYQEYERDLAGDGYSNEYQRAYAQSRLERPLCNHRDRAAKLTLAGYSVVLAEYEVCCPVTDALIGYDVVILKACRTLEEAQAWVGEGDHRFIFQAPEPPEPEPSRFDDDEIPF